MVNSWSIAGSWPSTEQSTFRSKYSRNASAVQDAYYSEAVINRTCSWSFTFWVVVLLTCEMDKAAASSLQGCCREQMKQLCNLLTVKKKKFIAAFVVHMKTSRAQDKQVSLFWDTAKENQDIRYSHPVILALESRRQEDLEFRRPSAWIPETLPQEIKQRKDKNWIKKSTKSAITNSSRYSENDIKFPEQRLQCKGQYSLGCPDEAQKKRKYHL